MGGKKKKKREKEREERKTNSHSTPSKIVAIGRSGKFIL